MTTREARLARWQTTFYASWATVAVLLLLYLAGYVFLRIVPALAPFIIAFLFVFGLQGPVTRLEARGLARGWATALLLLFGFAIVSAAIVFIAPPFSRQLVAFANAVPSLLEQARLLLTALQVRFSTVVVPTWASATLLSVARSFTSVFVDLGRILAVGVVSASGGLATVFFDIVLAVVIAFWTLKDLPTIRAELRTLAGSKYEEDLENLVTTVSRMVGGYLKGQTVASLVTGTVSGIGLALIGVPYALVMAIIVFFFNYVPYIGPFAAALIAGVLGFFVKPIVGLGAIVIVVVAQNLTDALVTPRVMSEQVDLHPTLVIFSLLLGGTLLGFWGVVFAIPFASTVKALFVYYYERRTQRQLATEGGALFKAAQCEDGSEPPCDEIVAPKDFD